MKAVNLIPADLRRHTGTAGATGPAVYVLLGALTVAVILVAAWAVVGRSVTQTENDLTKVRVEADAAEQRAGQLKPYAQFRDMRVKRVETVTSLSRSRFNWPFALREVSRVLPSDVWLVGVQGTVAPGVQVDGGGGGASQLRNQLSAPALELTGCSTSQDSLARFLARLRSIQGVTRVSLGQTEKVDVKADEAGSTSGSGSSGGGDDCRQNNGHIPKFDLVVFFEGSTATASGGGSGSTPAPTSPTSSKEGSK
jgi:Tfp pilus assembly protein PilN